MSEPKVTECWAEVKDGKPDSFEVYTEQNIYSCPAILLWREDYDALIKGRDELKKRCRYNLDPGAQVTNWDEYERVRVEVEELREYKKRHEGYKQILRQAKGQHVLDVAAQMDAEEILKRR